MRLKDKVVVLTGASSGIGKEVTLLFAKEGANIVAAARRLEKLNDLVEIDKRKEYAGEIYPVETDVTKDEDIEQLIDMTIEKYGRIDVLINNAGVLDNYQSVEHVDDDTWYNIFDVNVHGLMKLTRKAIPFMRKNKSGVIINTASVGGLHGMRGGLGYVATKHAVVGMSKNIAYMYANEGIRCNVVAPGNIATDISKKIKEPDMETLDKLMAGYKLFPVAGDPKDLAKTYLYLASDDSTFVNGAVIVVDGGWTAY
ncbi:MAG: SDR family oxidoreductase [Tissierellia bacterium]|nr:SDR family oxidoreductase [Tissierellia bacterium]